MKIASYEFIDPEKQIGSEDFRFVQNFLKATGRTQIGWHYITDLAWIYGKAKHWPREFRIVDLGGGSGPVQYLLAELGFHVVNIDLIFAKPLVAHSHRYETRFETVSSFASTSYAAYVNPAKSFKEHVKNSWVFQNLRSIGYARRHDAWRRSQNLEHLPVGTIRRVQGNLCDMPEFPSESFDAAVSLSALEHIPTGDLPRAMAEIRRVLKPDAAFAITTSGTEQAQTWFHEPSQGNCFSTADIERFFDASPEGTQDPDSILIKYRECRYLQEHLAGFYKKSGKYGMPWGVWDPKYLPLGIHA